MSSTIKFLRAQARAAGDVRTSLGQALHRATARVIRLEEDLDRVRNQEIGGLCPDEDAAIAAHELLRRDIIDAGGEAPPNWKALRDVDRDRWIRIVRLARGGPATVREAGDDD